MSTLQDVRRLAMALPAATKADHHGMVSFRVRDKIFATVPDADHLRVMLDENDIRAAAAENSESCREKYWGRKLSCVEVDLAKAPAALLEELLTDAWLRKASAAAARKFLAERHQGA